MAARSHAWHSLQHRSRLPAQQRQRQPQQVQVWAGQCAGQCAECLPQLPVPSLLCVLQCVLTPADPYMPKTNEEIAAETDRQVRLVSAALALHEACDRCSSRCVSRSIPLTARMACASLGASPACLPHCLPLRACRKRGGCFRRPSPSTQHACLLQHSHSCCCSVPASSPAGAAAVPVRQGPQPQVAQRGQDCAEPVPRGGCLAHRVAGGHGLLRPDQRPPATSCSNHACLTSTACSLLLRRPPAWTPSAPTSARPCPTSSWPAPTPSRTTSTGGAWLLANPRCKSPGAFASAAPLWSEWSAHLPFGQQPCKHVCWLRCARGTAP